MKKLNKNQVKTEKFLRLLAGILINYLLPNITNPRDTEIMLLYLVGKSSKEIKKKLGLGISTQRISSIVSDCEKNISKHFRKLSSFIQLSREYGWNMNVLKTLEFALDSRLQIHSLKKNIKVLGLQNKMLGKRIPPEVVKKVKDEAPKLVAKQDLFVSSLDGLTVGTKNRLKGQNIETTIELAQWTRKDLLKVRGLGKGGVGQIETVLARYNLHLGMEEEEARREIKIPT